MLYCSEVTKELERLKFEEGTFLRRSVLKFHLLICKDCKKYEKDSISLDNILKAYKIDKIEKLTSQEIEEMTKKVLG